MQSFRMVLLTAIGCSLLSGVCAAPVEWKFIDNYKKDFDGQGVEVTCPDGSLQYITSTDAVSCLVSSGDTVTFSVVTSGKATTGCKAVFDNKGDFDATASTCLPDTSSGNQLVFSGSRGIHTGTIWTISDADADDLPVTVTCPDQSTEQIDRTDQSVFCFVKPKDKMSFSSSASGGCTAQFDAGGNFSSKDSTCTPAVAATGTITFSASQGILPAANSLIIGFEGTVKATCKSGNCSGTGVNLTDQRLALSRPLSANGEMTLAFSTSGGTDCEVSFYNQFVNNRQTTCQNVKLSTLEMGFTENKLAFPTDEAGDSSVLQVYPPSPPSQASATRIGSRTFTFENHCDQPVWFNLVSGTVGPPPDDGSGAKKNTDGNLCANAGGALAGFKCPHGTTCRYVNDDSAYCFYDLPDPAIWHSKDELDNYKLDAKGGALTSNSITVPVYEENPIIFSGGASARIGCQDSEGNYRHCAIGNCNADENALGCDYTTGTGNGATIAEFTLQKDAIDFYDISVINGAHIPVSMQLTAAPAQQPDASKQSDVLDEYWCGSPGSDVNSDSRLACDWNFSQNLPTGKTGTGQAQKYYYINVSMPAGAGKAIDSGAINLSKLSYCANDSDCTSGSFCGLSMALLSAIGDDERYTLFSATGANGKSGPFTCGERLGITTPVNICALVESGADGYLNCNTQFSQTPPAGDSAITLSYSDLYACKGATDNCIKPKSDYTGKVCCGCSTWQSLKLGIKAQDNACTFDGSGANSNSYWDGSANDSKSPPAVPAPDVEGKLTFLKRACPTAYVYQYDDATSTFNCFVDGTFKPLATTNTPTTPIDFNASDYTISFCPGETAIQ